MTAVLAWEPTLGFPGASARAEGGSYHVWKDDDGHWRLTVGYGPEHDTRFGNEMEARAAGERDFSNRIAAQP